MFVNSKSANLQRMFPCFISINIRTTSSKFEVTEELHNK